MAVSWRNEHVCAIGMLVPSIYPFRDVPGPGVEWESTVLTPHPLAVVPMYICVGDTSDRSFLKKLGQHFQNTPQLLRALRGVGRGL